MAQPLTQASSLSTPFLDMQRFYRSLDCDADPTSKGGLQRKDKSSGDSHALRQSLNALCGQLLTENDIVSAARALANTLTLSNLPLPGLGETGLRMDILCQLGACDLALARLLETHADACAILHEANRRPRAHALYGLWTARHPTTPLRARHSTSGWLLSGALPQCLAAHQVDRALIAADAGADRLLFDINALACSEITVARVQDEDMERAPLATIVFDAVRLDDRALIGPPNFYSERRGAWASALGAAACQLGGATGLLRAWLKDSEASASDPHALANLGASFAALSNAALQLTRAAHLIDDRQLPGSVLSVTASEARYVIEQACKEVMQRMDRALGSQLQSRDPQIAQRCAELSSYLRQSHAERTLEELGKAILEEQTADTFQRIYSWL